jgi:glycolate oxidase
MGEVLTEDICVPRMAVTELFARIEAIAAEHDVRIACLAHAGDGNVHPMVVVPPGDTDAQRRGSAAFERVVDTAVDLGGTVTGEHGVGLLKMRGLTRELSPAVMAMHRAVKNALDPAGILNPGKVFSMG